MTRWPGPCASTFIGRSHPLTPLFLKGQRGLNIEKHRDLLAWSTGRIFGKTTLDEKSPATLQSHIFWKKFHRRRTPTWWLRKFPDLPVESWSPVPNQLYFAWVHHRESNPGQRDTTKSYNPIIRLNSQNGEIQWCFRKKQIKDKIYLLHIVNYKLHDFQ